MPHYPVARPTARRLVLAPGLFRLCLAAAVIAAHSLPLKLGIAAVYLFFALSGYWVYVMWHGEYAKTISPYFTFIISRAWRLLPVYLLGLAFAVPAAFLADPSAFILPGNVIGRFHYYFSNLFLLGLTRLPPQERIMYPAWSLDIELQFYVIVPFLILLWKSPRFRILLLALTAISLLSSGWFLVFFEGGKALSGYLPMYLVFFLAGLATAHFKWNPPQRLVAASLLVPLVFVLLATAFGSTRTLILDGGGFPAQANPLSPAANFAVAILLLPYAMATVRLDIGSRRGMLARMDRHLSNLTYETYLLHQPVILLVHYFHTSRGPVDEAPWLIAGFAIIGMLSVAVYLWFDRSIDAWRRQFVKSRARTRVFEKEIAALGFTEPLREKVMGGGGV